MKILKRGVALFVILALMFSTTACQKRSLKDAKSWEDAVEICLGKYDVARYQVEGSSITVMVQDIGPAQPFIADCSALATCFTAQAAGTSTWEQVDTLLIGMYDGDSEHMVGILSLFYKKDERVPFGFISVLSAMRRTTKAEAVISAYGADELFSSTDGRENYGFGMEFFYK